MGHPYKKAQEQVNAAKASASAAPEQQPHQQAQQAVAKREPAPGKIAGHKGNSVLVRLAERFQMDPATLERTIRQTVLPSGAGATSNEQLAAFLIVADQYGLNPFTKQIYAFPAKGGGITPIVSIDGWYQIMNNHPQFDGLTFEDALDGEGKLVSVTARVHRKDRVHPTEVTEYMAECFRGTEPWRQWPRRMLRHKAAIQAARAAFGLAGIYDPDEGERIGGEAPAATAKPAPIVLPAIGGVTIEAGQPSVLHPVMAAAAASPPAPEENQDAEPAEDIGHELPHGVVMPGSVFEDGRYSRGDNPENNPACPECGGPMWDHRGRAILGPKKPAWRCKGELPGFDNCEGVRWPKNDESHLEDRP